MKQIACVYMVAGLSSRFLGKIKQLVRIGPNNERLIGYSLNQALSAEFTKIVFVVGNKTEQLFKKIFGNNYKGVPVIYAFQKYDSKTRDRPWGTVDALCTAKNIINCPFVICNGDDIYGGETFKILFNHLQKKKTNATVGYKLGKVLPKKGKVNRGIFEIDKDNTVKSIRESFDITKDNLKLKKLTKNSLCSMNIFALQPEVSKQLNKRLIKFKKEHQKNRKIECLLPEEINNLIQQEGLIMKLYPTSEKWYGITNPGDEIRIRKELKNKEK